MGKDGKTWRCCPLDVWETLDSLIVSEVFFRLRSELEVPDRLKLVRIERFLAQHF